MTIWQRVVFRSLERGEERFTVLEKAVESSQIRRSANATFYSEAELRATLTGLGESTERIDVLLAAARQHSG